jgi:type I restriction enzyme S subunit
MGSVILLKMSKNIFYKYLLYYLKTPLAQTWLRGASSSTAVSALYLKDVAKCPIPLPPIKEQYRIVEKLDELMILCDHLKNKIELANTQQKLLIDTIVS